MNKIKDNNILINTIMLYGLSFAKIIFPLLTLPYLTRILSTDAYGIVAYVKGIMQYIQLIIDFGFMLSGTKAVVNEKKILEGDIGRVAGEILFARIILTFISLFVLLILMIYIPLLNNNIGYTILSFLTPALSILLFDYLFRGIEKMQIITIRFIVMKAISTFLTFIVVKEDNDIIWIPILDILSSAVAVLFVFFEIKKEGFHIKLCSIKKAGKRLKESAVYFVSNMATTAYGALNIILIGIFLTSNEVAYWSICTQIITAVQMMYMPITDGIYPEMVKTKNVKIIKDTLCIFMPIDIVGVVLAYIFSKYALWIVGGEKYILAVPLFRNLIPLVLVSFPGVVLGWPTLGAIDKEKQITRTTILAAIIQVVCLCCLILFNQFTIYNVAKSRVLTETALLIFRGLYCVKYKCEFNYR